MRRALISDLFSTLVPGGETERQIVNWEMAQVLSVEPAAFTREFDTTAYERFTGAYGDLPSTLRLIARRSGGDPTDEQVHQATVLRRQFARHLLGAASAGTLGRAPSPGRRRARKLAQDQLFLKVADGVQPTARMLPCGPTFSVLWR